jgi:hypothetical protein
MNDYLAAVAQPRALSTRRPARGCDAPGTAARIAYEIMRTRELAADGAPGEKAAPDDITATEEGAA